MDSSKLFQKLRIDSRDFLVIDSIQNLRAEDSFITRKNKLQAHDGKGEARKYIGSYIGESGKRLAEFFEYSSWGNTKVDGKRTYPIVQKNCFFSKSNLLKYLDDSRVEYEAQEQVYRNDISQFFNERFKCVKLLESSFINFSIYDVSDFLDARQSRAYIRSDSKIWKLWRQLVLPRISYLSILKLVPIDDTDRIQEPHYYFRIFIDYQFRSIVHPRLSLYSVAGKKDPQRKVDLKRKSTSREGGARYREKVLEYMPQCPFTKISDERLLIASHIKPYQVCIDEGNLDEANDFYNGLSLSPTFDKLFDQGYITFLNSGQLICGTQLSSYTWSRLALNPNAKNILRIYPEGREKYLEYHRERVFLDNIEDLM